MRLLLCWLLVLASVESSYRGDATDDNMDINGSSEDENEMVDDEPRLSGGSDFANLATLVLPHPKDVVESCVYYLPKTKYNRPPSKAPNTDYHFFFDLEDTIYTRRKVQIRKYEYLAKFLEKKMKIDNQAEIEELILRQKPKLKQMLELHKENIRDPYTFIKPDEQVTELISSIKANRWIFTKSNL